MAVNLGRLRRLSPLRLRHRLTDERRGRLLAANAARDLTPPPPRAFGAFGERSVIGAPARVTRPDRIFIGSGVVVHEHAWISVVEAVPGQPPTLTIGDGTLVDRLLHIACAGEIEIGRRVLIGERVLIGDTFHQYEDTTMPVIAQPLEPPRKVTIGDGCAIGLGACIMPGVTVGENSMVAAGAVVHRDVPPYSIVVGNPARVVRSWAEVTED